MPAASHMQIADNDESTVVPYVNDFRLKKETIQIDFERLSFHAGSISSRFPPPSRKRPAFAGRFCFSCLHRAPLGACTRAALAGAAAFYLPLLLYRNLKKSESVVSVLLSFGRRALYSSRAIQ